MKRFVSDESVDMNIVNMSAYIPNNESGENQSNASYTQVGSKNEQKVKCSSRGQDSSELTSGSRSKIINSTNSVKPSTASSDQNGETYFYNPFLRKPFNPFVQVEESKISFEVKFFNPFSKKSEEKQIFECNECSKTYKRKYDLTRHRVEVHGDVTCVKRSYECNLKKCSKVFLTVGDRNKHSKNCKVISSTDPDKENKFVCETCNKKFARKATLTTHQRSHNQNKNKEVLAETAKQEILTSKKTKNGATRLANKDKQVNPTKNLMQEMDDDSSSDYVPSPLKSLKVSKKVQSCPKPRMSKLGKHLTRFNTGNKVQKHIKKIKRDASINVENTWKPPPSPSTLVSPLQRKKSSLDEREGDINEGQNRVKIDLEELLRLPEKNSEGKTEDDILNELDREIAEKHRRREEEMSVFNAQIDADMEARKQEWRDKKLRSKENARRRNKIERELTEPRVKELFQNNLEYLTDLWNGNVESARYTAFNKSIRTRHALFYRTIADPFTEDQTDWTMREIRSVWMKTKREHYDNKEFAEKVILPECLIKFYCDLFHISKQEAEKSISETPLHKKDRIRELELENFGSATETSESEEN